MHAVGEAPQPPTPDASPTRRATDDRLRQRTRALLCEAAATDLADDVAWAGLVTRAHHLTRELVASGQLPSALVVARDDPAVVAQRVIATAWRHVDAPSPNRLARRGREVTPCD